MDDREGFTDTVLSVVTFYNGGISYTELMDMPLTQLVTIVEKTYELIKRRKNSG